MKKGERFLIGLLSIVVLGATLASQIAFATKYDYSVPYISQLNYEDIGHSACAPTSITMLVRYYFPNSGLDVPEVYHSGIQGYRYHGPARYYKNVSFQSPDQGLEIVDPEGRGYYNGNYSGLRSPAVAAQYLNLLWGGQSYGGTAPFSEVISEIKKRPLILNIHYDNNPAWGHYIVLRGYDDNGTPSYYPDDEFYVNDPYPNWPGHPNGNDRELSYATLSSWYAGRIITFNPTLSEQQRQYTLVVDNSNVSLDNINNQIWWEYYGPGDWYYPLENGHWAKWEPRFPIDGEYEIHVVFRRDNTQTNVTYRVHDLYGNDKKITVDQKGSGWADISLGTFPLGALSYVQVDDVPEECNIDAMRFEYVGPITWNEMSTIFTSGWTFFSVPLDPVNHDPIAILCDDLEPCYTVWRWNPTTNTWDQNPPIDPGKAYLIWVAQDTLVDVQGSPVGGTGFVIRLLNGSNAWNMIGQPYDFAVKLLDFQVWKTSTEGWISISLAAQKGYLYEWAYLYYKSGIDTGWYAINLIDNRVYLSVWDRVNQKYGPWLRQSFNADQVTLNPWSGVWLWSYIDAMLFMPANSTSPFPLSVSHPLVLGVKEANSVLNRELSYHLPRLPFFPAEKTKPTVFDVQAFPNPATDEDSVTFTVKGEGVQAINVEIFDLSGRRVFESGFVGNGFRWNLQNNKGRLLANGVYTYIITIRNFNGEVFTSKVKKIVILR